MKILRSTLHRILSLFRRPSLERDLHDELASHLQHHIDDNLRAGLSPDEARRQAVLQLGGLEQTKESVRDQRSLPFFETLWLDLRYGLRLLRKSPGFTFVAVFTLALGIGATTAIFSVIENVLIDPFPYKDSGRLVYLLVHDTSRNLPDGRGNFSSAEFMNYTQNNHVFDRMIATSEVEVLYKQPEGTLRLYGARVTPGIFELLGVPALYGRIMQPDDFLPGAPPVFVMRYQAWISQFGGDPAVLSRSFILNGTPCTLIGIMPPRFAWYEADVLIPANPAHGDALSSVDFPNNWFLVGHLKPGVSIAQAGADLTSIAQHLSRLYPHAYPEHFNVQARSLLEVVVGRFRSTLYIVLAAVALLLLIACGNVANLLLARATGRRKEFALRAALGADRSRIIRQLLLESLLLALAGSVFGTLLAAGGLKLLVSLMPPDVIPAEAVIQLNAPVLAFSLAVAALTALLFGLSPALQVARTDVNDSLRSSGRGGTDTRWHLRWRDAIIIFEVALSLTLLVGAGLLMRSFVALRQERLGFRPDHVLVVRVPLPQDRYETSDQLIAFFSPLFQRLQSLPGVLDVAVASAVPPNGGRDTDVDVAGSAHQDKWSALFQTCSEGYFSVLRFDFTHGRPFTSAEVHSSRKVAVVNATFARTFLHDVDPIGQRLRLTALSPSEPSHDPWFEIVGVVSDVKNRGLQQPSDPEIWIPYTTNPAGATGILLRTTQDPLYLTGIVSREIWAVDPGAALAYSGTLDAFILRRYQAGPRFSFLLTSIFGALGLVLVSVGVYSVLAYATARRTQEMGIRMSLGAQASDVLSLVLKSGLRLILTGVAFGVLVSLAVSRVIASQLWRVSPYDPATLLAAIALLFGTGVLACYVPARRATKVDPMICLRSD